MFLIYISNIVPGFCSKNLEGILLPDLSILALPAQDYDMIFFSPAYHVCGIRCNAMNT